MPLWRVRTLYRKRREMVACQSFSATRFAAGPVAWVVFVLQFGERWSFALSAPVNALRTGPDPTDHDLDHGRSGLQLLSDHVQDLVLHAVQDQRVPIRRQLVGMDVLRDA